MRNVKSKFSIQLIFTAIVVVTVLLGSLVLCILPSFVDVGLDEPVGSSLLWVSLIVLLVFIITIVQFNKVFKKIIINDSGVVVSNLLRKRHYAWSDLSVINTELYSNDGDVIVISTTNLCKQKFYVDSYSNRALLYQVFNFAKAELSQGRTPTFEKFSYMETPHRIAIEGLNRFLAYGKNQLLTMNTIFISMCFAFTIFGFIPLIFKSETSTLIVSMSIGFSGLFFCLCYVIACQMFYFQINDIYLLVRHPFLPISRTYLLSDIKQVAITIGTKRSTALRVLTLNYNSDIFPAGGMRNREWSELLLRLQENGVFVRNDSVTKDFMK